MATQAEIEAAKKRFIADNYQDTRKFIEYTDKFSSLEFSTQFAKDVFVLAKAFLSKAQSVNEILLEAAKIGRDWLTCHENETGVELQSAEALRKAIAAAEAEIEERRKPITREWLQSIGSKRVPDDLYLHSEGNDNEQIGRLILWEFNDTGVWKMRDADWFDMTTRGDVLDLMRVLGGAT